MPPVGTLFVVVEVSFYFKVRLIVWLWKCFLAVMIRPWAVSCGSISTASLRTARSTFTPRMEKWCLKVLIVEKELLNEPLLWVRAWLRGPGRKRGPSKTIGSPCTSLISDSGASVMLHVSKPPNHLKLESCSFPCSLISNHNRCWNLMMVLHWVIIS